MVDLDIIEPVDEPTDWVNGLVIQTENYEFDLTLDLSVEQSSERSLSSNVRSEVIFEIRC